jgi:hypothetical protein
MYTLLGLDNSFKRKVKLSMCQAVEAHKVVRHLGSHIFWTFD